MVHKNMHFLDYTHHHHHRREGYNRHNCFLQDIFPFLRFHYNYWDYHMFHPEIGK
jgi:hypothetical protein